MGSITTNSSRPFAFAPGEEPPDARRQAARVLGVSIVTARNSIEAAGRLWRALKNHTRSPRPTLDLLLITYFIKSKERP